MPTFAIIENNKVVNTVEADELMVLALLIPEAELVVEVTESTGTAFIGEEYREDKKKFVPIHFYPSWTWDEKKWAWKPPVTYPKDGNHYIWNEEALSWEIIDLVIDEG